MSDAQRQTGKALIDKEQVDELELYRCAECGKLSVSIGWLHGHIETHRPVWQFWRSGQMDFLMDRTEVITITEYEVSEYVE